MTVPADPAAAERYWLRELHEIRYACVGADLRRLANLESRWYAAADQHRAYAHRAAAKPNRNGSRGKPVPTPEMPHELAEIRARGGLLAVQLAAMGIE